MQINFTLTSFLALAASASASLYIRDAYTAGYEAGLLAAREAEFAEYDDEFTFTARDLEDDDELQFWARGGADQRALHTLETAYEIGSKYWDAKNGGGGPVRQFVEPSKYEPIRFSGGGSSTYNPRLKQDVEPVHNPYRNNGGGSSILDKVSYPNGGSIASKVKWPKH